MWQQLAELDLEAAALVVARARALTRAVSVATAAGHGELAVGDVMGTLRIDRSAADRLIVEALLLVSRPAVCQALESGLLGLPHARALLDVLGSLSPAVADEVEPVVLARAAGRPPARIRALARREAISADPKGAAERRRAAAAKRYLSMRPAEDGMAYLGLLVRAVTALAIVHGAEQATRAEDGSGRTRDQRRADWIVDRVLGQPATDPATAAEAHGAVPDAADPQPGSATAVPA